MTSSTPTRSIDPNSSRAEQRFRSISVSNSSRASQSAPDGSLPRSTQTPKTKRKNMSNRPVPYISPARSRASQSRNSTITIISNNQEIDDNIDLSAIDVNIVHVSSQQVAVEQEPDPFERSSDDEQQVNECSSIFFCCDIRCYRYLIIVCR